MKKNIPLKNKNTFKIGGKAKYYATPSSKEELLKVLEFTKKENLPYFILGKGSNLLISDKGFPGVVIELNFKEIIANKDVLKVGAGVSLNEFILKAKELNLGGVEWAIGIPGTIGGALYGNAGVPNHTISSIVKEVEVLKNNQVLILKNKDCNFSYRDSIFKQKNDFIILSGTFELKGSFNQDLIKEFLKKRKIIKGHSIGSIFKNGENYFAGKLIDDCGLKGKRIGDAIVSDINANWIINLGNATSEDVEALILIIKKEVKKRFNIDLKEEIKRLS